MIFGIMIILWFNNESARIDEGESGSTNSPQMEFNTTVGNKLSRISSIARSAFHGYGQGTNTGGMQGIW